MWNLESPGGVSQGNPHEEHSTDDDDAVARARAGDLDAYGVLVARYTAAAHRTACLLGAGDDADDVVQEAFVKGFRGLASFRVGASFRPWLLQIVANETRNLRRSWRRRAALDRRLAAVIPDTVDHHGPETQAMAGAGAAALLAAVRALPDKDRLVVTCRYFLDLSEAETAQVLDWPPGTVKSRLSRALGKLRQLLPATLGEEAANE